MVDVQMAPAFHSLAQRGQELLQSRECSDHAAVLIGALSSSKEAVIEEAAGCMQTFFMAALSKGDLSASKKCGVAIDKNSAQNSEVKYRSWLKLRYQDYWKALLGLLGREDSKPSVKITALEALMELVRNENQGSFNNALFASLCSALVSSSEATCKEVSQIAAVYMKYADVRYFMYINMQKLAHERISSRIADSSAAGPTGEPSTESFVRNMFEVLCQLPTQGDLGASWSEGSTEGHCWSDVKKVRKAASKCWLTFLRMPLPLDVYKQVLVKLPSLVMPSMTNPVLLGGFLTSSYDAGGVVSVLALHGLFVLITEHGLEYPDFYKKLYALLEPSIFVAKHRARFFELVDVCLKSSLLPRYVAAAFTKRLARLALTAPPSGAVVATALIHNLLRRHPSINTLVHSTEAATSGTDPFLMEESDPEKCHALESSLWEMDTLRSHYAPVVARFVDSLETDLSKREKTSEVAVSTFSSGSYGSILLEEASRRTKQAPLAFYERLPSSLFASRKAGDVAVDEFIGWSFAEALKGSETGVDGEPVDDDEDDDDDDDDDDEDDEGEDEDDDGEGNVEGDEDDEEGEEEDVEEGEEDEGDDDDGVEGEEDDDDDDDEEGEDDDDDDGEEGEEDDEEGEDEDDDDEDDDDDDDDEDDEDEEDVPATKKQKK